jgi:predicted esterase
MDQKDISFQYKARFYQLGKIDSSTKQIWFVLHGYGQLARFFMKKFSVLEQQQICVIAPEGLSRFYLESFAPGTGRANDRVGATWMTKENRLTDIENYIEFLTSVYLETAIVNKPVTILGFSQGSATASRWALSGRVAFERLILWAGLFPPDINFDDGKEILKNKKVLSVYGNSDPFLNGDRFSEMRSLATKLSSHMQEVQFEGGHDIDEATLLKIS